MYQYSLDKQNIVNLDKRKSHEKDETVKLIEIENYNDATNPFANIENQIHVKEHIDNFEDLEKRKNEDLKNYDKVELIEIANDQEAIHPLLLDQDTSAEFRDSNKIEF